MFTSEGRTRYCRRLVIVRNIRRCTDSKQERAGFPCESVFHSFLCVASTAAAGTRIRFRRRNGRLNLKDHCLLPDQGLFLIFPWWRPLWRRLFGMIRSIRRLITYGVLGFFLFLLRIKRSFWFLVVWTNKEVRDIDAKYQSLGTQHHHLTSGNFWW